MLNPTVFGSNAVATSSVQWKAATSPTSGNGTPVFQSTGASGDSVSVSKLGKALSGVAADAFKHLDSKARGALENLVNTGKISAEEAVLGLRSMATQATFMRYGRERTRDQEDIRSLAASEAAFDKQKLLNERMGAARQEFGGVFAGLQKAQERGEITMEQVQENLRPAQEKFDTELAAVNAEREAMNGTSLSLEDGFAKTVKGFNAAMASTISENGFTEAFSEEANTAAQKLQQLGFNGQIFGNAFKNFAATVDIPGLGRAAGATPPTDAPVDSAVQAAPAQPTTAEPVAQTEAPTAPQAAASAAAQTVNTDSSNSAAALSLLQSALNAGTKSATPGLFGNIAGNGASASDSVADSLLQSLKAGTGKGKTDDAQGV